MMPRKRGIIAVPAEAGTQPLHLPRERGLRLALTPLSLDGRGVGERVALVAPHRPSPAGGEGENLVRLPEYRRINVSSQ